MMAALLAVVAISMALTVVFGALSIRNLFVISNGYRRLAKLRNDERHYNGYRKYGRCRNDK